MAKKDSEKYLVGAVVFLFVGLFAASRILLLLGLVLLVMGWRAKKGK